MERLVSTNPKNQQYIFRAATVSINADRVAGLAALISNAAPIRTRHRSNRYADVYYFYCIPPKAVGFSTPVFCLVRRRNCGTLAREWRAVATRDVERLNPQLVGPWEKRPAR